MKEQTLRYLAAVGAVTSILNGANIAYSYFHPKTPILQIQNLEITCENCPAPYQKLVRTQKPVQYDAETGKVTLDMLAKK
ncbi:MAG TPA: hypothetical protein VKE88_00610 [Candidatus Nanoarchaeia archaeon]|nr:hypothetical protein [Candidatus Nanoarchaeia archaeon]